MAQVKQGDRVQVHYTGKLEDGTVFDTSKSRHPLQFTIGQGQVIAGFEQAVTGMHVGDYKTAVIPVEQAYGARREDLVVTVDRKQFAPDLELKIGQRLEVTQEDNQVILVTIAALTDSTITLDANHPLAGKPLTFELELVGIV